MADRGTTVYASRLGVNKPEDERRLWNCFFACNLNEPEPSQMSFDDIVMSLSSRGHDPGVCIKWVMDNPQQLIDYEASKNAPPPEGTSTPQPQIPEPDVAPEVAAAMRSLLDANSKLRAGSVHGGRTYQAVFDAYTVLHQYSIGRNACN